MGKNGTDERPQGTTFAKLAQFTGLSKFQVGRMVNHDIYFNENVIYHEETVHELIFELYENEAEMKMNQLLQNEIMLTLCTKPNLMKQAH